MISYTVAFSIALVVSAFLTPLVRNISLSLKATDDPGARKIHDRAVPRTGGIAIALAFLAPVVGISLTSSGVGEHVYGEINFMVGILGGGVLIVGVGLLDDFKGLGAKRKFILQAVVASFAYVCGFRIEAVSLPLGHALLEMGFFSYLVTLFWIVGIINAVNLIDGLDGLAGGIGFFVLVFNFILGFTNNSVLVCLVSASLAGAVLGFLFYNFNPASIFMGDSGSMFIGYVLALGAINSGQKSSTTVALLTPLVAMGIPVMDTLFSMVRRFLEKRPIFSPDQGHIHHRLLGMGLNQKRTVMVLYALTVVLVLVATMLHFGGNWQVGVGLIVMVVTLVVFARAIGMADYFTRRRAHRLGVRTRHAELLRKAVFAGLQRADAARELPEVKAFLEWLLTETDMEFAGLHLGGDKEPLLVAMNSGYSRDKRMPSLVVIVPLFDGKGKEFGYLRFGWQTDRGQVTSATETLLQVMADRLAAGALHEFKLREESA